jgi:hypothetical protein
MADATHKGELDVDESLGYKSYRCMSERQPTPKLPKAPHPGGLMKVIRRLTAEGKITLTIHALNDRLDERNFDISDVQKILRIGEISGNIKQGNKSGEWSCLVTGKLSLEAAREVGVATIVVREAELIIKTVEWIDP